MRPHDGLILQPEMRRTHDIWRTLLLLVGAIVVSLALAEVLVRIFAPHARDMAVPSGLFVIDGDLGWRLNPGTRVRHRSRYFDATYSINSFGSRDQDRDTTRADARRILVFGDSQIFGWGVAAEQRATAIAERSLDRTEVWNMAVPGYGLDQEALAYLQRSDVLPAATDVVFYVGSSTVRRMAHSNEFRKPKPRFVLDSSGRLVMIPVQERASLMTGMAYRLISQFYLPYLVNNQLARLQARQSAPRTSSVERPEIEPELMSLALAVLDSVHSVATARRQGMRILSFLPEEPQKQLEAFSESRGIPLTEVPMAAGQIVFGERDYHWRPEAHRLVAAALLPVLSR